MSTIKKPWYKYTIKLQLNDSSNLISETAEGLGISDRDHSHLFVYDEKGTLSHAFQRQKVVSYSREYLKDVDVEVPDEPRISVPGYNPVGGAVN